MNRFARIRAAREAELCAVQALYQRQIGRAGCTWNQDYPDWETLQADFSRGELYVLPHTDGSLVAAVSLDYEAELQHLPVWQLPLRAPYGFARLCVDPSYQGQGIATELVRFCLRTLQARHHDGVRFLVSPQNEQALGVYRKVDVRLCGQCWLFEQPFLCFEGALGTDESEKHEHSAPFAPPTHK